jgi:hypothetical protein
MTTPAPVNTYLSAPKRDLLTALKDYARQTREGEGGRMGLLVRLTAYATTRPA